MNSKIKNQFIFRYFNIRNFEIPKIGRSTFGRSKYWQPPKIEHTYSYKYTLKKYVPEVLNVHTNEIYKKLTTIK